MMTLSSFILHFAQKCSLLRSRIYTMLISRSFAEFGKRSTLTLPVRVGGEQHISIGNHVHLGPGCWLQIVPTAKSPSTQTPRLKIGDHTSVTGGCMITAAKDVVLEEHVLIGRNVHISDHRHAYDDTTRPIKEQGIDGIQTVRICQGAWIGQGAVICPGVTIGRNAIIGANSVVRNDVPELSIAAGIPARVIRTLSSETRPSSSSLHSPS